MIQHRFRCWNRNGGDNQSIMFRSFVSAHLLVGPISLSTSTFQSVIMLDPINKISGTSVTIFGKY